MDEIYKIRIEMKELGWESEDRFSPLGWENGFGYSIWFKRDDWHGKNVFSITGHEVCFHEHVKNGSDYNSVLEAVKKCAEKSKQAWIDYPNIIPCQTIKGITTEIMHVPFEEGLTKIKYSKDLTLDLKNKE